jgi:MinD-like ATPase involved in chromosome partitioning or flagellar assembly
MKNDSKIATVSKTRCETISLVSGKGGTGKTFIVACLAYALQNAGQRVCLIDTDFATQGLSLFILGPGAERGVAELKEENSLYHMVKHWHKSSGQLPAPKRADRLGKKDHDTSYQIIISNKQFYDRRLSLGVESEAKVARVLLSESMGETNDDFRKNYQQVMHALIQNLIRSEQFDYLIIDTRGGFGELSLIPAVFADSFLVVAEPDFTSFHQLAKLLTNIDLMAQQEKSHPYIRGVIVNKAVDGEEEKFRVLLETQFGIEFSLSWPFPLDVEAIRAYKQQLVPYRAVPGSVFSDQTLKAFTEIFDIVTAEWTEESKRKWHDLLDEVEKAHEEQQKVKAEKENKLYSRERELENALQQMQSEKEKARSMMNALEIRLNEEKSRREQAEEKVAKLQDDIRSVELGGVKKIGVQRTLVSVFVVLAITLAIFAYSSWQSQKEATKNEERLKLQLTETQNTLDSLRIINSSLQRHLLILEQEISEAEQKIAGLGSRSSRVIPTPSSPIDSALVVIKKFLNRSTPAEQLRGAQLLSRLKTEKRFDDELFKILGGILTLERHDPDYIDLVKEIFIAFEQVGGERSHKLLALVSRKFAGDEVLGKYWQAAYEATLGSREFIKKKK